MSSSEGAPAAASSDADTHDAFSVKDVKIGMAVGGTGFVCTKQKPNHDLDDTDCVKFDDPRCAGRPSGIGELRYGEKAPLGCFLDPSSHASYLDGTLLQTPNTGDTSDPRQANPKKPLSSIHVVGTASKPSRVYWIWYTFAPDDLTDDSKLYAALVGKYGEPTTKNPPHEMRWRRDETEMKVMCSPKRQCELLVKDSKFEELEERKQEEADARARHQAAPDAPKL